MTAADGPTPERLPVTAPTGVDAAPALARPPVAATPLLTAAGLALAAHALTVGTGGTFGVNVAVWVAIFAGVSVWNLRRRGEVPTREALTLLGLALAFAVTFAVWAVPDLFAFLNAGALLLCLTLAAAHLRHPGLSGSGVGALLGTAFTGGLRFVYGPFALLERFPWGRLRPREGSGLGRVGVGLALTVPVLLVFGGLLAGADGAFGRLVTGLFNWNLEGLGTTILKLLGWSALAGGLVYPALLALRPSAFSVGTSPVGGGSVGPRLGLIEVGLPLGALGALFVVFLGTQLSYFLSGTALPDGFTFAEYVRQGFGELMAVAFLTLALLLTAHGLTREEARVRLTYRLLNLAVLLPLALILLSAANRWRLYTLAYGLSEIRVLGAAFLVWTVLSLAGLAWLLWRGDLQRFAFPALLAGLGAVLITTALNPGALIARVNVNRDVLGVTNDLRRQPQQANVWTLLELGAGAVPVVAANLDGLTHDCVPSPACPNARQEVLNRLREEYGAAPDPRTWNLSRERARRVVEAWPFSGPTRSPRSSSR